jgi:hypothetical protein
MRAADGDLVVEQRSRSSIFSKAARQEAHRARKPGQFRLSLWRRRPTHFLLRSAVSVTGVRVMTVGPTPQSQRETATTRFVLTAG